MYHDMWNFAVMNYCDIPRVQEGPDPMVELQARSETCNLRVCLSYFWPTGRLQAV